MTQRNGHLNLLAILLIFSSFLVGCLEPNQTDSPSNQDPNTSTPTPSPAPVTTCDDTLPSSVNLGAITSATQEVIPLCAGEFIYQNQTTNEIGLVNLVTQTVIRSWSLNAKPLHMVIDNNSKYLYVALSGLSKIAKIDVTSTATPIYINTSAAVSWLALGNNQLIFANLTAPGSYWGNIDLIDSSSEQLIKTITGSYSRLIIYDQQRNQLITGDNGLSPSSLKRYSFDSVAQTLTLAESVTNAGSNGTYLSFSPDFSHLVFNAGAGNLTGYELYDYDPSNLASPMGTYSVGAYPTASGFSPDSQYVITNNYDYLKIYNANTHALSQQLTPNLSSCSYSNVTRVGFSKGGKLVYIYATCGSPVSSGFLLIYKWK